MRCTELYLKFAFDEGVPSMVGNRRTVSGDFTVNRKKKACPCSWAPINSHSSVYKSSEYRGNIFGFSIFF